ncbi:PREDICTED: phylloquinone omega-hydroxylase CYP4F2-like, partial [Hipposideros armiger]|uniref:Phylloquinone omega-hydroxylase CYP4F2-like n=1 Tax=Hipposideros armiger TaxID=186990 RepID=A0A8B7QSE1_HIPAR
MGSSYPKSNSLHCHLNLGLLGDRCLGQETKRLGLRESVQLGLGKTQGNPSFVPFSVQAKWQRRASDGSACLDMYEHISLMALDSLQKCIFSFDSNCQEKPSEYIASILELSSLVAKWVSQVFLPVNFLYHLTPDGHRFRRACRLVHDFTDAVIQERRRTLSDQGVDDFLKAKAKTKMLDFIDVLLMSK